MLNAADINSHVLYLGNCLGTPRRRTFLKLLSKELVAGELARRSLKTVGMLMQLQVRLQKYRPPNKEKRNENEADAAEVPAKRQRCSICNLESGRRRLLRYECRKCNDVLCLEHAVFLCRLCFGNILLLNFYTAKTIAPVLFKN